MNVDFLCSLPRAGNTLLGSIINQNKNLNVTANTILADIIYQLHLLKKNEIFLNFPDEKSLNNVIKNSFNNYYKDWEAEFIIDRGPWGTPDNLKILKSIIKNPKFIILNRPPLECLASYIQIEQPKNIEERCNQLMSPQGMIGKNLWSIKNIIDQKENYIITNYDDLVNNPLYQINKIYNFLNIEKFNHDFENINQFSANNIKYNDYILNAPFHTIKTGKIKLDKIEITKYIPHNIIKKYSNLDIV
jgi:hypothetical protein|tara:strand:+ start:3488 stop:4225 length:738 start_codon:yes stop_codon:yes gene_type:complete